MRTVITPPTVTGKNTAAPGERPLAADPQDACDACASDRIRERAYEIYQARNGNGHAGDAVSDWVQAEKEVRGAAPEAAASDVEIKRLARGERLLCSGE